MTARVAVQRTLGPRGGGETRLMSGEDETDYDDPLFDDPVLVRWQNEAGERLRQRFDEYAPALGRCMLAYNELDYRLEQLIEGILGRLGAPKLPRCRFDDRVDYLHRLKSTKEGRPIANIQTKELKEVDKARDTLAHAHFEPSPISGDDNYRLVSRAGNELEFYDHSRINSLTQRLDRLSQQLLAAEYGLVLGPLPDPFPPSPATSA
jgi:hypothetical protein